MFFRRHEEVFRYGKITYQKHRPPSDPCRQFLRPMMLVIGHAMDGLFPHPAIRPFRPLCGLAGLLPCLFIPARLVGRLTRLSPRSDFLLEAVSRLLAECLSPSERESILEAAAEAESHGIEEFSDGDPASELASAYRESLERKG